jgi:hypothetical protein
MEMSRHLYAPAALPPGKELLYPLDRRLGGPQSRPGRGGEKKNSPHCPCQESNPGRPARSLATIVTELSWIMNSKIKVKSKVVPVLN